MIFLTLIIIALIPLVVMGLILGIVGKRPAKAGWAVLGATRTNASNDHSFPATGFELKQNPKHSIHYVPRSELQSFLMAIAPTIRRVK